MSHNYTRAWKGAVIKINAVADYSQKEYYPAEVYDRFGEDLQKTCEFKVNYLTPAEIEKKKQQEPSSSQESIQSLSDFD